MPDGIFRRKIVDQGKVQVSVARYLRTPPYGATRKDLVLILRAAYAASAIGARLSLATVILDR